MFSPDVGCVPTHRDVMDDKDGYLGRVDAIHRQIDVANFKNSLLCFKRWIASTLPD
ncbi:MAG: hypothetical protein U9N49_04410 [Campylobacterota bacterium]|nr:hypothetical protein [Campylobacterota bacterium]